MTARDRARLALGRLAGRVARRLDPPTGFPVHLDHPPAASNRPRWGYGRPAHPQLRAAIAAHHDMYRHHLELIAEHAADLARIDAQPRDPAEPCWVNPWLLGLDTASLYGLARTWRPPRIVEVGSGNSTLVLHRARRDGGFPTHLTSIDPQPRLAVDDICDRVVRSPLEAIDLGLFAELEAGDMVFVDCSHRLFMNSDATTFHLDVLPTLAAGVIVGVHDILLPDDYLPEWDQYWFSEQYLFAAYLLAGAPWIRPLLACNYASQQADLAAVLAPVLDAVPGLDPRGFCFWFRIDRNSVRV